MRNCAINPHAPTSSLVAAVCRCQGRCNCGPDYSYDASEATRKLSEYEKMFGPIDKARPPQPSFDSKQFEVLDVYEATGGHLVLKVKYTTCQHRAYEGIRVMVFLNARLVDAIKWREIDPHFNKPVSVALSTASSTASKAPSPDARFPASAEGWAHAKAWADSKFNPREST